MIEDKIFTLTEHVDSALENIAEEAFEHALEEAKNILELRRMDMHEALSYRKIHVNKELNDYLWNVAESRFHLKIREYVNNIPVN